MRALTVLPGRRLPVWLSLTIWLSAFFSPTVYFLFMMVADRFQFVSAPPEIIVASLFFLIPAIALLICGLAVWWSGVTIAYKIGGLVFTLIAMLLQFGTLLVVIMMATG